MGKTGSRKKRGRKKEFVCDKVFDNGRNVNGDFTEAVDWRGFCKKNNEE